MFEFWVLNHEDFNPEYFTDKKTNRMIYPIRAKENGFYIEIDKYKGFFMANYKEIHNSYNSKFIKACRNMTYSKFKDSLSIQLSNMFKPLDTNITKLKIGFWVDLKMDVRTFLNTHLILHNFSYYNLNKLPGKKKDFIEFKYDEYSIELSTCTSKSSSKNKRGKMKIIWNIEDKNQFKLSNPLNISELFNEEVLRVLFDGYIKKFNELIIIDKSKIVLIPDLKEKELMLEYRAYGYWKSLNKYKRYRNKKKFLELVKKYELDSINVNIKNSLIKEFSNFINN